MRATRALMEGRAQRAWLESTRSQQDHSRATIVQQGRILQLSGPPIYQHALSVGQTPARLVGVQSASAMSATLDIQEAPARHAS